MKLAIVVTQKYAGHDPFHFVPVGEIISLGTSYSYDRSYVRRKEGTRQIVPHSCTRRIKCTKKNLRAFAKQFR